MSQAELDVVKAALHDVADELLPKLIAAEEARLPLAYQVVVKAVVDTVYPALQKAMDDKIDALAVAAAPPAA